MSEIASCIDGVARAEIKGLREQLAEFKGEVRSDLSEIKQDLRTYAGRPTWGVATALTGLVTVIAVLLTVLFQGWLL